MPRTRNLKKAVIMTFVLCAATAAAHAQDCAVQNRLCVLEMLGSTAAAIENDSWRDQTYRELAKTKAFDGDMDGAIALIEKIVTPDTKAMTIRGIGMTLADKKLPKKDQDAVFVKLREAAEKITHPPSYAIALTYIAMAQAFAEDDEGAWATAASMKNDALRHKAYGETAEIQAEAGHFDAAMKSVGLIDSESYRNKALLTVAKLLADHEYFAESLKASSTITNPYEKAAGLQYVLDAQKPRETERP